MSAHNSGISEVPVPRVATNCPPCLVVAHFHPSLHHCLSTSKTHTPLSTTGTDYKWKKSVHSSPTWKQATKSAYHNNELQHYIASNNKKSRSCNSVAHSPNQNKQENWSRNMYLSHVHICSKHDKWLNSLLSGCRREIILKHTLHELAKHTKNKFFLPDHVGEHFITYNGTEHTFLVQRVCILSWKFLRKSRTLTWGFASNNRSHKADNRGRMYNSLYV